MAIFFNYFDSHFKCDFGYQFHLRNRTNNELIDTFTGPSYAHVTGPYYTDIRALSHPAT